MCAGWVPEGIFTGVTSGTKLSEPGLLTYTSVQGKDRQPFLWVPIGILQPILPPSQLEFIVLLVGLV